MTLALGSGLADLDAGHYFDEYIYPPDAQMYIVSKLQLLRILMMMAGMAFRLLHFSGVSVEPFVPVYARTRGSDKVHTHKSGMQRAPKAAQPP